MKRITNNLTSNSFLVILTSFLLVTAGSAGAAALSGSNFAQVDNEATSGSQTGDRTVISPAVQRQIEDDSVDRVPVIIVFETQPEDQIPMRQLSTSAIRGEMKGLAENTQQPTLEYLEQQQQQNNAADIQSLYLRNAIAVEANTEVIEEVASTTRVEKVILDAEIPLFTGSKSGIDEFRNQLNETGDVTVDPTGFERVVEGEPARGIEEIQAGAVQDAGITGSGVNVSVVDTGINDSHPALEGQVIKRKNFAGDDTNVGDPNGHGTHVAGTIAGKQDADRAVGVAPGANLFDARVGGDGIKTSDAISAFEWSADNGADVVSGSFGFSPIPDRQENRTQIENQSTANISFDVYSNASETPAASELNTSLEGFQPSYVYLLVDNPEILNASSSVNQTAAVENLSVTLHNPDGAESLQKTNGAFVYQDGTVPDDVLLYKFKTDDSRQLDAGSWNVTVTNENDDTGVGVDVGVETFYPSDGSDQLAEAANNLESSGVIPVFAAGNDGMFGNRTLASPASAENAISVGASAYDTIDVWRHSSRGPVEYGAETRPGVDVIAPGVNIYSAGSPQAYSGSERYVSKSGTSMAAPHVSGTIALLLDANPTLDRTGVETALESTAQSPPRGANAVGAGALDAYAAVDSVTDGSLEPDESVDSGVEVYAGLGKTAENNVYTDVVPDTDPVGDAASAPDIEKAAVAVESDDFISDADFALGLADDTAPNASFVTYIDVDQNDTTGDLEAEGAEYRLNVTRSYSDGSYEASIAVDEYDEDQGVYDPAAVDATANDVTSQFVSYEIDTDEFGTPNQTEFDWYVVSQDSNSESSDRAPDTGVYDSFQTINGIGVAWDAAAGEPIADYPLTFRLYEDDVDADLISNKTVRTTADGVAEASFNVSRVEEDYELQIETDDGEFISQEYYLDDNIGIDRGSEADLDSSVVVIDRGYETRLNRTFDLNVPIYSVDDGTITPYEGPASIQFESGETINNLTVPDGMLTRTVNSSNTTESRDGSIVDFEIALTGEFNEADETYYAGDIDHETDVNVESTVSPGTKVTSPQSTTTVTFQNIKERDDAEEQRFRREPANVTSTYEIRWITDRQVAAFYNELPDAVAGKLAIARTTEKQPESLSSKERAAVEAAITNASTQDTVPETVSGTVTPEQRGIGQFEATPPEDARYGFVEVTPASDEDEYSDSGFATIYVDGRLEAYQRSPTAPNQDSGYRMDVDGDWETEYNDEEDISVPNESIEVDISVVNDTTDEPVPDTDVTLYTTGGDSKTVTTNSEGEVSTTIPAPDIDYKATEVTYEFERQQILAIANGLQTETGAAVSATDEVDANYYDGGEDTETDIPRAVPELDYDDTNETLGLEVTYRNSSTWDETNASATPVLLGTPYVPYTTQRDVFAGYLGNNTDATTITRNFSESVPNDLRRQYGAVTGVGTDNAYYEYLTVNGISAEINSPDVIEPGNSTDVTVTLTNRTGEPVSNASVVLKYEEAYDSPQNEFEDDVQSRTPAAGNAFVGTTNEAGEFTVTISPNLADESNTGDIRLRTGYATDSVADPSAGFGSIQIGAEEQDNDDSDGGSGGGGDGGGGEISANLTASPTQAEAGATVTFTAETTNFTATEYQWDLDGDGNLERTTSTSEIEYEYTIPGSYTATVTAIDDSGATAEATTDIEVIDTTDPTAVLDVPSEVVVGEPITINASGSTDNSDIANYTFTLSNESGVVNETTTTESTITGTPDSTGEYSISLTVTDLAGNTNTTETNVTVISSANLQTSLTAEDPQRFGESVAVGVTVNNTGDESTTQPFTVRYNATAESNDGTAPATNGTITFDQNISADGSVSDSIDLTEWVTDNSITGDVTIDAEANINNNVSDVQPNDNVDTTRFSIIYANLTTTTGVSDATTAATDTTLNAYVRNTDTATANSTATTATIAVTNSSGSEVINTTASIQQLSPGERNRTRLTEELDAGTYTLTATVDDTDFPGGNGATETFTISQYDVSTEGSRVPEEVKTGQRATAAFFYSTNDTGAVNATLELNGSGLELQPNENATKTIENPQLNQRNFVVYDLEATSTVDTTELEFNVSDTDQTEEASTNESVDISLLTETVSNSASLTVNETNSESTTLNISNEDDTVTHNFSLSVQAGTDGRTLQGLEYLVNYPYGCVEQTTSAFLGALNTDQYYRDRPDYDIDDDRQETINGSIAEGVERLNQTGVRAQQTDGSWNMWGRTGAPGDTFYSVYALYGTANVENDEVYGAKNAEGLNDVDFDKAVVWLNETDQKADGSFDANSYIDDPYGMTGFTMIALDKTNQTERVSAETRENITNIYAHSTEYLVQQQKTNGSWDNKAKSTALAVHGLQVALEADAHNQTDELSEEELRTAVEDGKAWLIENQNDDGSWDLYHDSGFWNYEGDRSITTAYTVMALNETGVPATNATISDGTDYLIGVYEEDGSWGYPRATAISIEALDELTDGQAAEADLTIILDGAGTIEEQVEVNSTVTERTISLNETQLETIRGGGSGTTEVDIESTQAENGTIIVGAKSTQEVVVDTGGN